MSAQTTVNQPIQMVDLHGQYQRIREEVNAAIQKVIDSSSFIGGDEVKLFAAELAGYCGAAHAIPCANGTDALQIALMAAGLKPGDEVITSPFTFIATAEVIALLGLRPVFADVEPDTFCLDAEKTASVITGRTRCLIPVHLFGQPADMEPLMALASEHDLFVAEDNAQALGAEYTFSDGSCKKAGTMGQAGCTSFFPSKNLGCYGDGGAILTNDTDLAERISMIANHGSKVKYYHEVVGVNSRLDAVQAAVLRVKLRYLGDYTRRRQEAAASYDELLGQIPDIRIPSRRSNATHVFHQYTICVPEESRDDLKKFLESRKIPAMIYYPVCLHLQNAYHSLGYKAGSFPEAEKLSRSVLSLPMHTELTREQAEYIAGAIKQYFN